MGDTLFLDPAGQNERTSLAWQRTALSVTVAALVVTRLAASALGGLAVVVLAVSLALAGTIFLSARWEYRRRAGMPAPTRGVHEGARALLLALDVVLLGAVELAAIAVD